MKNTLKISATIIFSFIVMVAMCVNANAQKITNNCTAQATGHFDFTVEAAIGLTVDDSHGGYGGICPGCSFKWNCGEGGPYISFTVRGGKDCYYNLSVVDQVDFITECITLQYFIYFLDQTGQWTPIDNAGTPPYYYLTVNENGIGFTEWGLWVSELTAKCCASPGNYDFPVLITVNYDCEK